jgi:hypothetical protein
MSRPELQKLGKQDLHRLAACLAPEAANRSVAIRDCVEFVVAETGGFWHGRARAMMCRRLKHCELSREQSTNLLECILDRLATGRFSEQFRDQLRLAISLDADRCFEVADQCRASQKEYVRRFAAWVAAHRTATSI